MLLRLATHRFTCVCHFSKQFTTHRPTSHLLQKYSVVRVCFFSEHTRHRLCFPLEGQCCECFTSKRLRWNANGLGLPLQTPLAVAFSSCERIIRSRTRTSRKLHPRQGVPLDCTFHKICCSEYQKSFLFSKVYRSLGRHDLEDCHCLQNEGIVECGKSGHVPSHLNKMEYSTAPLWTNNL